MFNYFDCEFNTLVITHFFSLYLRLTNNRRKIEIRLVNCKNDDYYRARRESNYMYNSVIILELRKSIEDYFDNVNTE